MPENRGSDSIGGSNSGEPYKGLIAVDKHGGHVLLIDPKTHQTILTLTDFERVPHELVISSDRKRAYVPIYGDGVHGNNPHPGHLLSIIDLVERAHIGDIDLSPCLSPHGLQFGPDGFLYLACEDSGVVLLIDTSTREIVDRIETGSLNSHRTAMLPDGRKLYAENEEDASVSVIDVKRRQLTNQIKTPCPLAGIAASPDGRLVVVVDGENPRLLLIDPARDAIVGEVHLAGHSHGAQIARYSPDGKYLLITSSRAGLGTILDSKFEQQTTMTLGKGPMDGTFHHDGHTLLVANQRDGTISIIDLRKPEVSGSFLAGVGCETLAFF